MHKFAIQKGTEATFCFEFAIVRKMSANLQLLTLALLGSVIALIGGVVFLFNEKWSKILEKNSVPFAAGVLITVALAGLLPEAHDVAGESVFVYTLLAFFGAYLFENVLFGIHHHEGHGHHHASAPLVIVGDTIHNLIDGIAIAASFLVSPGLGLITAVSTFLHEVPHEVGDFGVLLSMGWKKKKIFAVNLFSSLMTVVGAFALLTFQENEVLVGSLMSISAGIFLYLGASDFLPKVIEGTRNKMVAITSLLLGVAIMLVVLSIVPHGH